MESTEDTLTPICEQASHWWVILHGEGATAAERREFAAWVSRSPERIGAYLETERLMRALKSAQVSWPDTPTETLIRDAHASHADIVTLYSNSASLPERTERVFPLKWATLAALLIIALSAAWFLLPASRYYETAFGEQHSVVLDDGSLVTLNTASRIEVDLRKERRLIRLLEGEALFQVAQDKTRPFEVIAGAVAVRAVGTQFNIDRRPAKTTVTVLEGKVLVGSVPAVAGERVVARADKVSAPEHLANLAPAVAWTQRRLIFERRPLGEVTEEFNRYNRQLIRIESPQLRQQEVTGVFQANDPDSFIVFLSKIPGVAISQSKTGEHIVTAQGAGLP